jgi:predicted RNA binding protein YcfA (HicA-like mRNA interferase family)
VNKIDYGKLGSLTARELITSLLKEGFIFTRQRGSHHRYYHPDGRRVTVPFTRSGDTFARETLRSIIEKQAKWNEDDLKRLNLLK